MTGNLSPDVPKLCPKCGVGITARSPANLIVHLRYAHKDSGAVAIPLSDPLASREFFYIAPVPGASTLWHVLYVDWPYEVARLDRTRFRVAWLVGDGPKEGA